MRSYVVHMLSLVFIAAIAGAVSAQARDEKKPERKPPVKRAPEAGEPQDKAPAGQPSPEEMAKMMEVWKKAAAPGEFHDKLKPLAGHWTYVTKFRMGPDQPWEESTGNAEYRWILGGRLLVQEIKGNPGGSMDQIMGYPFEGFGITGYDNTTKKYYNIWADNMGTGMMTSTGSVDGSGKVFTYTGDYDDPMLGHKTVKSVLKIEGDSKLVFEMYDKDPAGKEYSTVEVTYSRKK